MTLENPITAAPRFLVQETLPPRFEMW